MCVCVFVSDVLNLQSQCTARWRPLSVGEWSAEVFSLIRTVSLVYQIQVLRAVQQSRMTGSQRLCFLSLSSSFGKAVAPPTIPITCPAPPECDIITTLLDDTLTPPPAANETSAVDDELTNSPAPPPTPPDLSGETVALPLPPPPPPPPPLDILTNHSCSPAVLLETGLMLNVAVCFDVVNTDHSDITVTSHLCLCSRGGEQFTLSLSSSSPSSF